MTEPRTALVVMRPGRPVGAVARPAEVPPAPDVADQVVGWFRGKGFETGPVVGISFAVTGSDEVFAEVLGEPGGPGESGDRAFALDAVPADVRDHLDAVVLPGPPAFGPGNP